MLSTLIDRPSVATTVTSAWVPSARSGTRGIRRTRRPGTAVPRRRRGPRPSGRTRRSGEQPGVGHGGRVGDRLGETASASGCPTTSSQTVTRPPPRRCRRRAAGPARARGSPPAEGWRRRRGNGRGALRPGRGSVAAPPREVVTLASSRSWNSPRRGRPVPASKSSTTVRSEPARRSPSVGPSRPRLIPGLDGSLVGDGGVDVAVGDDHALLREGSGDHRVTWWALSAA